MKKLNLLILLTMILFYSTITFGQDNFVRQATIDYPPSYGAGFGEIVSGVDLDNDGNLEIYAVNGMSDFYNGDEIPQIVKYERHNGTWDSVWSASFPDEEQNTWSALDVGDLDSDGKKEIIWGFPNNLGMNYNPPRIVVFEVSGNGDDVLGIPNGENFDPNAKWNMDVPEDTEMRPLKWVVDDIDNDGTQEVIFADRRGYYGFGVASVDNIPDHGGGTENWVMEVSGRSEFTDRFVRNTVIDPAIEGQPDGGFGNVVSGVDYDNDGLQDLYAVNNNWTGSDAELTPILYKFELEKGAWVKRWESNLGDLIPAQNTWPILETGDMDSDGKGELIWCPPNNLVDNNQDPYRILVFETPGNGTDQMGIDDGTGNYKPNAKWNMDVPDSTEMRPFDAELADIDEDGTTEFIFTDRRGYYQWGVVSVDNIPDNGDGSEFFTMEANGMGDETVSTSYKDLTVAGSSFYIFDWNGQIYPIHYQSGSYVSGNASTTGPLWSFRSAVSVDVNDDGAEEVYAADYASSAPGTGFYIFQESADSMVATEIADLSGYGLPRCLSGDVGDIDGDGLVDFIFGGRSNDVIVRVEYQGGDITSSGSYTVNQLDSGVLENSSTAYFDLVRLFDIYDDGKDEVVYTGTPIGGALLPVSIGEYSNTLEFEGDSMWDIVVANENIYPVDAGGTIYPVDYVNGQWNFYRPQPGVVSGSFLSAQAHDIDGSGEDEVVLANWYTSAHVNVLDEKHKNLQLVAEVYLGNLANNEPRLNGGAIGDIDNDGLIDFVTGSREADPNGQIYRVEHTGGAIDDPMNYNTSVIDQEVNEFVTQYEVINMANLDDDADLEVAYTSDYARGPAGADDPKTPIIILDYQPIQPTPIDEVIIDADNDYVPDNLDQEFTIQGVVTTANFQEAIGNLGYNIQDETGGIRLFAFGDTTDLDIGDLARVTGTLNQFNGLTELIVDEVSVLGTGTIPAIKELTVAEYFQDPEEYENELIRFNSVSKKDGEWPSSGNAENLTFWDGYKEFTVRIDSDTDLDDNPEPTYPVDITGVASQFTSSEPANDGYQLMPSSYNDDINQGVNALPNPYYFMISPDEGEVLEVDSSKNITFKWNETIDLNGDNVLYQFRIIPEVFYSEALSDTVYEMSGEDILSIMNEQEQITLQWTVVSKGSEVNFTHSIDTATVTFIKATETDVEVTQGWNMVSVPMESENMYFNSLFPSAASNAFSFGETYDQTDTLTSGQGYWLKFDSTETISVAGDPVNYPIPLNEGWNMVAPFSQEVNVNSITTDPSNIITSSFFGYGEVYYETSSLIPGKGYWVKANQEGTLNYNVIGKNKNNHSYMAEISEKWGKIYVKDASGKNKILYVAEDLKNPSRFELPPQPPKGVFDVRYGNDSYAISKTKSTENIMLNSCSYPVTIQTEGISLSLKDNFGGDKLNTLLKKGESIVISDQSVNRIVIETKEVPTRYVLMQNYPNPFNPKTKIKFGIPEQTKVNLKIYNTLGEEVSEIVNKELEAGFYEYDFNAEDLSSGVYIYRIETNKFNQVKKMMLLK